MDPSPADGSGEIPKDRDWRPKADYRSPHARLDTLRIPVGDSDPDAARRLCGEVVRTLLGPFSPGLVLLPRSPRERIQALIAFAATAFDFARQTGVEGEKLAQLNRWGYTLEETLFGDADAQQPVFVALQLEHRRLPWGGETLSALLGVARRRATMSTLSDLDARRVRARLAKAVAEAMAMPWAAAWLAAVLETGALVETSERKRRGEPAPSSAEELVEAANGLVDSLRELEPSREQWPREWRRAGRFVHRAALELLERIRAAPEDCLAAPPGLSLGKRLALLWRSF